MSAPMTRIPAQRRPVDRGHDSAALRPVPSGRRRKPRVAYAIVAVFGALAIGAAQMTLSVLTTQSSYVISQLTQQQRELDWKQQILQEDLAGLNSPQYLAANATALGMVINQSPSYLRLSDGTILGPASKAPRGSTVNALGATNVANSLISQRPLVTEPGATVQGNPKKTPAPGASAAPGGKAPTPPPIADGLPSPKTR